MYGSRATRLLRQATANRAWNDWRVRTGGGWPGLASSIYRSPRLCSDAAGAHESSCWRKRSRPRDHQPVCSGTDAAPKGMAGWRDLRTCFWRESPVLDQALRKDGAAMRQAEGEEKS
jgi:hypothetical protein